MIISWKNRKLQKFFEKGERKGIDAKHADKLLYLLSILNAAKSPVALDLYGYDFHELKGNKKGLYAIRISGNYRLVFGFKGDKAIDIDLIDYH